MINASDSLIVMIDIQDKLTAMLDEKYGFCAKENALKIIKAADILNIKTIITEQYPKGLAATIQQIRDFLGDKYFPFEKTSFSVFGDEKISNAIKFFNKKQIIFFGIESHICVLQSAIEAKEKGYEVYVIEDIVFSRNNSEKISALNFLRQKGVYILTLEMLLFMWLKTSKHPSFKEVQALIK